MKEKQTRSQKHRSNLYMVLRRNAELKEQKATLTLDLMMDNPVGIGDHSTDDFYNNAIEALESLADARDQLEALDDYFDVNS